jgi:hypothetical protein
MSMRMYADRGRGEYAYEDTRENYRRTSTRAQGSYQYGDQGYSEPQASGPRVRIIQNDRPADPQVVVIRDPEPAPIHIYREGGGRPQVRYMDEGGPRGGGPQYVDGRGPRYEDRGYDDRYDDRGPPPPQEDDIPYRPSRAPNIRDAVIAQAEQEGPGIYEVNHKLYEAVEGRNGRWQVFRTNEPVDGPDVIAYRPRGADRGYDRYDRDSDRGPRKASEEEPKKSGGSTIGNIARIGLRVAGGLALAGGAFYALSGVVGGLTHGMSWGPLGRTAMNWQQAVPAVIGGGALMATGGLLMHFTKKKT